MEKALVIFDIDGTIDGLPSDGLRGVLGGFASRGLVFGINTNRPFADTVGIYEALGMTGPLITEDGAEIRFDVGAEAMLGSYDLMVLNDAVTSVLSKAFGSGDRGAIVVIGDDKRLLDTGDDGRAVLVTTKRKFTASVYAREGGKIVPRFTGEVLQTILDGLGSVSAGIKMSVDSTGGKIIGSNAGCDRIKTLFRIAETRYPSTEILVVSDSEPVGDSPPKHMTFAAVSGSSHDYAARCQIIAQEGGIEGIRRVIEEFCRRHSL